MWDIIRSRGNKIGAGVAGLLLVLGNLVRPVAVFAAPGSIDDFNVWSRWFDVMPDWLSNLLIFAIGAWVAITFYESVRRFFARDWPDYATLDDEDCFSLREAAFYWVDQKPRQAITGEARDILTRMERAIWDRSFEASDRETILEFLSCHQQQSPVDPTWKVSRDDLRQYANSIGEAPPFLFPQERVIRSRWPSLPWRIRLEAKRRP